MATKLTKKQKGFVKDYLRTGIGEIAAINNYDIKAKDKGNVARSIASENLTKPNIVKSIAEALPNDLLAEKHLALLNKMETESIRMPDGSFMIIESNQIDSNSVSKGLDMAYKIKSTYAPDKSLSVNVSLDGDLTPEEKVKLKELLNGNTTGIRPDAIRNPGGTQVPGK